MRGRILVLAVSASLLAPAGGADDYDPCKPPDRKPRIIIGFARSPRFLFWGGTCRAFVQPGKKKVCQGDTVSWSVINACDDKNFSDVFLAGLEDVTTNCTTVNHLGVGQVQEITCTLKADIARKAKYSVASGTRARNTILVDPELDIQR